jgi:ABC-type dipeptide transport system, periplasmic component
MNHALKQFLALTMIATLSISVLGGSASSASKSTAKTANPTKIVVGIPQDFDSLDPGKYAASGTQEVMMNIFSGLIQSSTDGRILPDLAKSYTVSSNLKTVDFKLRNDVLFHNGQKMTSKDVKYTFDRLDGKTADQTKPLNAVFAGEIVSVSAVSAYEVKITLNSADASFVSKLATVGIIPANSGPSQAKHPDGAGPYKFVSYTPASNLTMEKNSHYYVAGQPKIQTVVFKIYTDTNAAQLALKNREINIMSVSLDQSKQLDKSKFNVISSAQNMVQLMALNNSYGPFKDVRVRQAINYAIDKNAIIKALSPGSPALATNFCPIMKYYYNKSLDGSYKTNVAKAKTLLKEAGQTNLTFTVRVPTEYTFHVNTALLIQDQLKKAGITMNIETIDWNSWLDQVYNKAQYQATIIGFTGKLDPDAILGRYATSYPLNFVKFSSTDFDKLISEARQTSKTSTRAYLYKQAEAILTKSAASVYIMDPVNYIAIDKRLDGYKNYPISFIDLRGVHFK